jgi:type III secretion protein V
MATVRSDRMDGRPRPGGWGDIAVAGLVVAVVVMMIVPLPRLVVDLLLSFNLGLAALLLMVAVFVSEPLRIAAFPTLILVATLLRLGVNVTTTRLILSRGDAGDVVAAFGSFVVAGNLVVGLVVFAVITIVQYVVVARGAERVAEVAARFALDAMPGKQMAIDADLRAGAIDGAEAERRRAGLERESSFYGAMDGAMKFVKGDAIAAILIVLVNLVGGLVIGIGYRGMAAGEAVRTYSLLSVGEGLVAQIPALLLAVASGLLVTRVAGERSAVGDTIVAQVLAQPRALAAAALLLLLLAVVPGLPAVPFAVLGLVAGGAALVVRERRPASGQPGAVLATVGGELARPGGATLVVDVSAALAAQLEARRPDLVAALTALRQRLLDRLGVAVPPVVVRDPRGLAVRETQQVGLLGEREVRLALGESALAWTQVAPGDPVAGLGAALEVELARVVHELVGVDDVQAMLDAAAATHPVAVREVVPRLVSLPVLAEVVRQLLREQVPVRELPAVLEALATAPARTPGGGPFGIGDAAALADHVRSSLRRQISARWAPRGQLAAWTVDALIEDAVRGGLDRVGGVPVLALEPELARDIVTAARKALGAAPAVVLTSGDIRRPLRQLLESELPDVAVLAPHELAPGVTVVAAGRIQVL